MNLSSNWADVTLELAKLGGAVVVAIVALWLYVPAMNAQNQALIKSQAEDRAQFERMTKATQDKLDAILLEVKNR